MTDEAGALRGRDAIKAAFATIFAEFSEAAIRTEVEAVRFPALVLAIEEGTTYTVRRPGDAESAGRYVTLHVRQGDDWRIATVREEPADDAPPADGPAARGRAALGRGDGAGMT